MKRSKVKSIRPDQTPDTAGVSLTSFKFIDNSSQGPAAVDVLELTFGEEVRVDFSKCDLRIYPGPAGYETPPFLAPVDLASVDGNVVSLNFPPGTADTFAGVVFMNIGLRTGFIRSASGGFVSRLRKSVEIEVTA
jgi:hypothetical protein